MTTREANEMTESPNVQMNPVKSSNVEAVGYDAARSVLHVRFKGGHHYSYEGVPPDLHAALHGGGKPDHSIGKFVHEQIKGKFPHRKH